MPVLKNYRTDYDAAAFFAKQNLLVLCYIAFAMILFKFFYSYSKHGRDTDECGKRLHLTRICAPIIIAMRYGAVFYIFSCKSLSI